MECIIGNTNMGKATQIIRKSLDERKNIICSTNDRREILNSIAKFNKYEIPPIYTITEYVYGQRTKNLCSDEVIIDEAELCLKEILDKEISYLSMTI